MACLIKDARNRSPFWYVSYTAPDGRRVKKSTGQKDKAKAWEFYNTVIAAETTIASGSASERQLRKIINDALLRFGERKLTDPTIKNQLDGWVASKKGSGSDT